MLTHQSFVDGAACLFATILLVQPLNWIPGVNILDDFVCTCGVDSGFTGILSLFQVITLQILAEKEVSLEDLNIIHPILGENIN